MNEQRPVLLKKTSVLLNVLGPFVGLLFVIVLFTVLLDPAGREAFLSLRNFKTILTQTVIVAIGALGMTMIIVSGGIDLSVGSVIALSSIIGALLIQKELGLGSVVSATILTGGVVGLINGSLVAGIGIAPFIVTLGMMGAARGSAKWLADNQTVNFPESAISLLMSDPDLESWYFAPGVSVAVDLAIIMVIVMRQTVFGRHVFAIGSNEATARLCGIRTGRLKVMIYSLAGLFFGLAGLMQLSRLRQGDPSAALGIELDIIAAVVVGGASLSGGTGTILGSMIGALIMAVLRSGSVQMGWPNYVQDIIIGTVIILAVGLDKLRQGRGMG